MISFPLMIFYNEDNFYLHFSWNKNIFVARLLDRADAGVGEPGRTVNPLADAFGGSNPSPPTT